MVIYVCKKFTDTSLHPKMKWRIDIFSSEPESKFPNEANSDILGFLLNSDMMKSNHPQRRTSGSAFNLCLRLKRPQVKMPSNVNVPELVKMISLKRLQLITGKIGRNLIIFCKLRLAKWVREGVFVNSYTFQRVAKSQ